MFVIDGLTGIALRDMIRKIWTFLAVQLIALAIMALVPETVLWLSRQFGYQG